MQRSVARSGAGRHYQRGCNYRAASGADWPTLQHQPSGRTET
jgi:hypothetical protein